MSLQHYKSQLNEVSRHLIGNSVPPNNILVPFSLSSAQKKIGYHYWLLMQGSLLSEEGLKHSLDPAQWSNSLAQKLNSDTEFIGFSVVVVILKDKRNYNEKKWEKISIIALCVPVDPSSFRNWIFFDYQMAVYCQEKKAFIYIFFSDSARYSFPSRSFHGETQKVLI